MLSLLGIVVEFAILMGMAFILSKTVAAMPNKACRFVLLFVLCVPLNFVANYFNVRLLGYHEMGWRGAFIIALLFAAWGTFLPPQAHSSNTP
jgi:hypothetical protein